MTRYEEIMDHIEVTEEMRGRILTNIDRQMRRAGGAQRTRRRSKARAVRTWLPILAAAAVLLVVCSVTLGVDRGNRTSSSPGTTAQMESAAVTADTAATTEEDAASANVADASEAAKEAGDTDSALESAEDVAAATYAPEMYNSAEELAEAVGFEVQDLQSIPFAIATIEYYAIDDLAEIDYRSMGNVASLTYRKSPGTDDNSGDYSDYEFVEDAAIGEHPLTLKGNDERYYLATWTDGTYAYSIYVSDGCSHDEMLAMIEEVQ